MGFGLDYGKRVYFVLSSYMNNFRCYSLTNHSLLHCCTFRRYMAPNSVFLIHTHPLIMSSLTVPLRDSVTFSTSAFGQFHRISIDMSHQKI